MKGGFRLATVLPKPKNTNQNPKTRTNRQTRQTRRTSRRTRESANAIGRQYDRKLERQHERRNERPSDRISERRKKDKQKRVSKSRQSRQSIARQKREEEIKRVSNWICDVIENHEDQSMMNKIKTDVVELTSKYPVYNL